MTNISPPRIRAAGSLGCATSGGGWLIKTVWTWEKSYQQSFWSRSTGRTDVASVSFLAMESMLAKVLGQEESQLAAAEKRELLARLLKRLAHEIRNPLGSLDIHFQLLEEDLASIEPDTRRPLAARLGVIHGELHRLESIVEQFLRLAGPAELDLEPVEMHKIATHVCDLMRAEASTRQIEITSQKEGELPVMQADPGRLTQALMNLVINALQAVERNGRVEVTMARSPDDDSVLLRVQDTGPGIPAKNFTEIFDPYYSTKPDGNGLGLWIAQQIAVAHGGSLAAANASGGGAVFTLTLPLNRKDTHRE